MADFKVRDTIEVDGSARGNILIGTICMIPTSANVPSGWLICDGAAYNSSTNSQYASLFSVIGNVYGGTNNTNFQVPNLMQNYMQVVGATYNTNNAYSTAVSNSYHTHSVSLVNGSVGSTGFDHYHGTSYVSGGNGGGNHAQNHAFNYWLPNFGGPNNNANKAGAQLTDISASGHSHATNYYFTTDGDGIGTVHSHGGYLDSASATNVSHSHPANFNAGSATTNSTSVYPLSNYIKYIIKY